jgi:hypothetical protein
MALEKVCEMDVNIMNFSMHPCGLYEFHILRFVCEAYHVTYQCVQQRSEGESEVVLCTQYKPGFLVELLAPIMS